jgi:hypothetical protein
MYVSPESRGVHIHIDSTCNVNSCGWMTQDGRIGIERTRETSLLPDQRE